MLNSLHPHSWLNSFYQVATGCSPIITFHFHCLSAYTYKQIMEEYVPLHTRRTTNPDVLRFMFHRRLNYLYIETRSIQRISLMIIMLCSDHKCCCCLACISITSLRHCYRKFKKYAN